MTRIRNKEKERAYNRRYYAKHRERIVEQKRRWRDANREHWREITGRSRDRMRAIAFEAKDRPCADCGEQYPPVVMEFDHVSGDKVADVARLVGSASRVALQAEIAKCEVVCANCHRLRHAEQWGPKNHPTIVIT